MLHRKIFNNLKLMKFAAAFISTTFAFCSVLGQALLPDYNPSGRELPPGVPRIMDTNGNVVYVDDMFTTAAYRDYTRKLLLKEANSVANELRLPENLPITDLSLIGGFISPFGFSYAYKAVGNISTTNYIYGVERNYKFNQVTITRIDDVCRDYSEKYQLPLAQLNTNAAYQLATQWLAAVHMDVEGLNHDYEVHVDLDPNWNAVRMGELPKKQFTPIYYVSWLVKEKPLYSAGGGASVELFLPTKTLLSLNVDNPKYILRNPLIFTNLSALFPGKATIITNTQWDAIMSAHSK